MLERRWEPPRAATGDGASADGRAWRALAGWAKGDHACCAFCDEADRRGVVRRFATDAIDRGMRLLYLADDSDEQTVLAWLDEAGLEAGALRDAGRVKVRRAAGPSVAGGAFDPAAQVSRLADEAERARADGLDGLAVTTEMGWWLTAGTDPEGLVRFERAVGRILAAGEIAALCQYDALAFPDALRARIATAHSLAISTGPAGTVATRGPASIAELADREGLQLAGEVDAFAAAYLRARIAEQLATGRDVVLDLTELTFADVGAARVFAQLAESLDPDLHLVLEGTPPTLRRVLRLCRFDERPHLVLRDGERQARCPPR